MIVNNYTYDATFLAIFFMAEYKQKFSRLDALTHANLEGPLVHVELVFSTHFRLD